MRRLAAILAGLALGLTAGGGGARAQPWQGVLIASGEVTGYYYPVAGALCRVLDGDAVQLPSCAVVPTAGTFANLTLLKAGEVDFAILQSQAALLVARGEGGLAKDGPFSDLRAVMSLHGESVMVLSRPGSGVVALDDIKGKRVNLGRPGSFQRTMADAVLSAAGLSEGDLSPVVELDLDGEADALCNGSIDVGFFSGVHPMTEVASAIDQCGAVPVPVKVPGVEALLQQAPWLSRAVIRGGTYDGIKDDLSTIAMRALLVTTTRVPADRVYGTLRTIFANFNALGRLEPVLQGWSKAQAEHDGIAIPLHDGAQRFFAEARNAR